MFLYLVSCDLFTTRDPEDPDSNANNFLPPTSSDIVLSNFTNAFISKSIENYSACFTDSQDPMSRYEFLPSVNIYALYPETFDNWSLDNERRYFNSLISNIPNEVIPELNWTNLESEPFVDSVVYNLSYNLKIDHNKSGTPTEFNGKMRLTIVRNTNDLWSIRRWFDFLENEEDNTWSLLKAGFYY